MAFAYLGRGWLLQESVLRSVPDFSAWRLDLPRRKGCASSACRLDLFPGSTLPKLSLKLCGRVLLERTFCLSVPQWPAILFPMNFAGQGRWWMWWMLTERRSLNPRLLY